MKLKELRKRKKLTQAEVAKYLNVTPQAYANYERGDRTPDLNSCKILADLFGVSIEMLLDDKIPEIKEEAKTNTIVFFGRGEGRKEVELTDEEMKALKQLVKTMKNIPDEDNF